MENRIINLTQHKATAEQKEQGVYDLDPATAEKLRQLLTFEVLPSAAEIASRARWIAAISITEGQGRCSCGTCERCSENDGYPHAAMIGGAPYLMGVLERALVEVGIQPLYAFSERVSVEVEEGGKVLKTQIFKHLGFVEVSA